MSDWDEPKTDLGHPDAAIRLASAVHRFRIPKMNRERNLSFARSFKTTGKHQKTRKAMLKVSYSIAVTFIVEISRSSFSVGFLVLCKKGR